tara:strand:+ start:82 stop:741 length:660 start_codon:yes stop_codon:yes gene_type:complete
MTEAVIFDTETTGRKDPVLIEAAWLKLKSISPFRLDSSFCQRYNPGKPIELGALATHHIYDEELITCPPANSFKLPDNTEYIIGHNIDYDWNVIGQPNIRRICTLALARKVWQNIDAYSQSALLYYIHRSNARDILKNAHSAETDVKICASILEKICIELKISSFENLWEISEDARTPTVMPFGKHKGTLITDIPMDYKKWLLSQDNIDSYLKDALLNN